MHGDPFPGWPVSDGTGPDRCKSASGTRPRAVATALSLSAGVRIWSVGGFTDMRRGIDGLAALVQTALSSNRFSGHLFAFRGRRSDRVK
jgi:transposase